MKFVDDELVFIKMNVVKPKNEIGFSVRKFHFLVDFEPRGHSKIYLTRVLLSEGNFVFGVFECFIEFFSVFIIVFTLFVFNVFNLFIKTVNTQDCSFPFNHLTSKIIVKLCLYLWWLFFSWKRTMEFWPRHFFVWNFHIESIVDIPSLQKIFLQKIKILISHYQIS
jgi:hypothetical protein